MINDNENKKTTPRLKVQENVIDDYECGEFTPTFFKTGVVMKNPWWKFWVKQEKLVWNYEKVGNVVTIWGGDCPADLSNILPESLPFKIDGPAQGNSYLT